MDNNPLCTLYPHPDITMTDTKNFPDVVRREDISLPLGDDPEKAQDKTGHPNYHGIDTRALHLGADEVYEKKIAILNEALINLGMGSFQWKVYVMTGFGWFVDNVGIWIWLSWSPSANPGSFGCKRSP
jgi:hypothetical protein